MFKPASPRAPQERPDCATAWPLLRLSAVATAAVLTLSACGSSDDNDVNNPVADSSGACAITTAGGSVVVNLYCSKNTIFEQ